MHTESKKYHYVYKKKQSQLVTINILSLFSKHTMHVEYNIAPLNQDDVVYVINLIKIHFRENYSSSYKLNLIQSNENRVTIISNRIFSNKIKIRHAQIKAQKELADILSYL